MKHYTISEKDLRYLLDRDLRLSALECGGVDNWDWYKDSFYEYMSFEEKAEKFEDWDEFSKIVIDKDIKAFEEI